MVLNWKNLIKSPSEVSRVCTFAYSYLVDFLQLVSFKRDPAFVFDKSVKGKILFWNFAVIISFLMYVGEVSAMLACCCNYFEHSQYGHRISSHFFHRVKGGWLKLFFLVLPTLIPIFRTTTLEHWPAKWNFIKKNYHHKIGFMIKLVIKGIEIHIQFTSNFN